MARRRASSGRARRSKAATIARRVRSTQSAYTRHASAGSSSRLKLRARQHAAIAALGERALAGLAPASLMDTAVRALAEVLEVELTCDFEVVVTWVLGTKSPNRYRVLELSAPPRLAVDVRR